MLRIAKASISTMPRTAKPLSMTKPPTSKSLPPHPGDVLRERISQMGISYHFVGQATGATAPGMYQMINDASYGGRARRGMTAKMALRLSKFLGTDPREWLGHQVEYDLAVALSDPDFVKELDTIAPYDRLGDPGPGTASKHRRPTKAAGKPRAGKSTKGRHLRKP